MIAILRASAYRAIESPFNLVLEARK